MSLHPVVCSPIITPLVDVLGPVAWQAGGAGQTLAQRLAALGARLVWPLALTDAGVLTTILGAAPTWSDDPIVTPDGVDPAGGLPTFMVSDVDWSDSGTLRLVLTAQTASADIVGTVQVFGPLYATSAGLTLDDETNQASAAGYWDTGDVITVIVTMGAVAGLQMHVGRVGEIVQNHPTYSLPERSANFGLIVDGSETTSPVAVSCVATKNTDTRIYDASWKVATSAAVTAQCRFMFPDGLEIGNSPAVVAQIYIEDISKITSLTIEIAQNAALSVLWSRSMSSGLQNGWNTLRWQAAASNTTSWGTCYRARVIVVTKAATSVYVGEIAYEIRDKAQIVFIEDGGYKDFYGNGAYQKMLDRGYTVCWAVDPAVFDPVNTERITWDDLAIISGNGDEINYHGYDGAVTSTMTAAELLADDASARELFAENGYRIGPFRAAFAQNYAANHAALQDALAFYATPSGSAYAICWPPAPTNIYDIPRRALHSMSQSDMDVAFALLQKTHGLYVLYTHKVLPVGDSMNTSDANWNYFLSLLDNAVNEGWLEVTTFARMMSEFERADMAFSGTMPALALSADSPAALKSVQAWEGLPSEAQMEVGDV